MHSRKSHPKRPASSPLEDLVARIRERFPAVMATIDEAASPERGVSHLDLLLGDHCVSVAWSSERGFGLSSRSDIAYGEGPDETHSTIEQTVRRVERLLLSHTNTAPPAPTHLAEVRQRLGFSQVALAKRMKIQQASISKLERRSDARLSTLSDYLSAMGAAVQLIVRTKFGAFPLRSLGASRKRKVKDRRTRG